jgi:prevent-host-death family protein
MKSEAADPLHFLFAAPSLDAQRAEILRRLSEQGIEVSLAADLRSALRELETSKLDLVLCDLALPTGSGLDLLRALRARNAEAPAFLLCRREHPLLEAADLGAFCLELPVDVPDLLKAVESRIGAMKIRGIRRMHWTAYREKIHSVAATAAKNQFGQLLNRAVQGDRVIITKHEAPAAVLISFDEYQNLSGSSPDLDALRSEFDLLMARMQEPASRSANDSLFAASGDELAEAALAEARGSTR